MTVREAFDCLNDIKQEIDGCTCPDRVERQVEFEAWALHIEAVIEENCNATFLDLVRSNPDKQIDSRAEFLLIQLQLRVRMPTLDRQDQ